jgi:uncharacterized protein GlcG (DUF336 family)
LAGQRGFGIQWSFEGRFAVVGGGVPIVVDGAVAGGIGLSGGHGERTIACGLAGLRARAEHLSPAGLAMLVKADLKR